MKNWVWVFQIELLDSSCTGAGNSIELKIHIFLPINLYLVYLICIIISTLAWSGWWHQTAGFEHPPTGSSDIQVPDSTFIWLLKSWSPGVFQTQIVGNLKFTLKKFLVWELKATAVQACACPDSGYTGGSNLFSPVEDCLDVLKVCERNFWSPRHIKMIKISKILITAIHKEEIWEW